jgi:hypothetical protein
MKQRTAIKIFKRAWTDERSMRCWFRKQGYTRAQVEAAIRRTPDDVMRRVIEQPKETRHWGRSTTCTRHYVTSQIGDGRAILILVPLATRPESYAVRFDSRMDAWSDYCGEWGDCVIDAVYEAVEEEYGSNEFWCETCNHSDCDCECCESERWFPALNLSCGSSWGYWPERKYD